MKKTVVTCIICILLGCQTKDVTSSHCFRDGLIEMGYTIEPIRDIRIHRLSDKHGVVENETVIATKGDTTIIAFRYVLKSFDQVDNALKILNDRIRSEGEAKESEVTVAANALFVYYMPDHTDARRDSMRRQISLKGCFGN